MGLGVREFGPGKRAFFCDNNCLQNLNVREGNNSLTHLQSPQIVTCKVMNQSICMDRRGGWVMVSQSTLQAHGKHTLRHLFRRKKSTATSFLL